MKYGKELTTVLAATVTALGCGGKLMDMPETGYAPLDGSAVGEDGSVAGDDAGGSSSSGGSSSGGRSSSGGSSSGGSSSGGTATCGGTLCSSSQVCCVQTGGGGGGGTGGGSQACTTRTACTGIALTCGDAAQCPKGDVCCLALTFTGGIGGSSSCKTSCPTGGLNFQLCSTDAECPKGVTCQATGMGGSVCGGLGGLGGGGTGGTGGGFGGLGGLCAHPDTPIATPEGERPIASLHVGDVVLSVDHGKVRAVPILRVNRNPVRNHHVVSVVLENGRVLHVSEGHPTADGHLFRDLVPGALMGDVHVVSLESIPYDADATYDILPASDTGTYFAAGALIGSTLFK